MFDNASLEALFEEIQPLSNDFGQSGRYNYAKARKGNNWFLVKLAPDRSLQNNLQREVVWSDFMNRVAAFYPKKHLRGQKIERRIGRDGLVFDYIDAPVAAEPNQADKLQQIIPRFADMLKVFDEVAQNWKSDDLPDEPSRSVNLFDKWREWLDGRAEGIERLQEAKSYVESVNFKLTRCMQHGDLTPWQILEDDQDWIIYDGEKCGTDLFRFTDLAYCYGRFYTTLHAPETAQFLLKEFMTAYNQAENIFWPQFLPVLTHRTIGMIGDAYRDQSENDYLESALKLLNLCLDKDYAALTGA